MASTKFWFGPMFTATGASRHAPPRLTHGWKPDPRLGSLRRYRMLSSDQRTNTSTTCWPDAPEYTSADGGVTLRSPPSPSQPDHAVPVKKLVFSSLSVPRMNRIGLVGSSKAAEIGPSTPMSPSLTAFSQALPFQRLRYGRESAPR